MAAQTIYTSDRTALWLQRTCTSGLEFLGCHDVSDLTEPRGDITASRKRDGKGKFKVVATRRTTPDLGTVTFSFFRDVVNLLIDLPCSPNILVFYSNCGSDADPTNYDFIDYLDTVDITEVSQAGVVNAIEADGATDVGVDIVNEVTANFQSKLIIKPLLSTEFIISDLSNRVVQDISVCDPSPECGECDNDTIGCQTLWIITNGSPNIYGDAEIYKSVDGGVTWVQQTNAMTADSDDLSAVSCNGDVVVVTNGTTSEYQFTNDGGTTMTLVTTPDQIINDVFVLSPTKIWFAANGGNIYFSSDKGASIVTQDDGVATSQNLNSIHFSDSELGYTVGVSNAFVRSTDGGTAWASVTGPAIGVTLNVVRAVPDTDIVFIGDANGVVYRSIDKGATFTTVLTGLAAFVGGIDDIAICNCNRILVTGQDVNGLGSVRESIDGGSTFTSVSTPADAAEAINALTCCDVNTYFGVGDDGLIFKVAGESFRDTA